MISPPLSQGAVSHAMEILTNSTCQKMEDMFDIELLIPFIFSLIEFFPPKIEI